jgi:hypothetical protein
VGKDIKTKTKYISLKSNPLSETMVFPRVHFLSVGEQDPGIEPTRKILLP